MNENLYRTAQFSQDTRLNAAYRRREDLVQQAKANPTDGALWDRAGIAAKEYKSVYVVGGVCEALVMKWLKLKLKDSNNLMGHIDQDKTIERAFQRRAHHEDHSGQYGLENYYGLWSKAVQSDGSTTTKWAAKTVASSTHDYFHHKIRCPSYAKDGKTPNHSLAYYTSSGKVLGIAAHVYAFDPDYGEYKVPKDKFKSWLPEFLEFFYGTLNDDTLKLETMSVRPQGKVAIV